MHIHQKLAPKIILTLMEEKAFDNMFVKCFLKLNKIRKIKIPHKVVFHLKKDSKRSLVLHDKTEHDKY